VFVLTTVLITCAASQVIPNIIKMIRSYDDSDVKVVGIDMLPEDLSVGAMFCDAFYQVPAGSDSSYYDSVIRVLEKEKVRLIFPGSDEEAIALARVKDLFLEKYNCHISCSNLKATLLASNKFHMLDKISKAGLYTGKYSALKTADDLMKFADLIDYPKNAFIIKPKMGRGAKGFKIVRNDINDKDRFLNTTNVEFKLAEVCEFFSFYPDEIENYIASEYLPGDKYSSDVLFEKGNITSIVTRNNGTLPKINPPTQLADIEHHDDINDYIHGIASIVEFDFFLQIETGRDADGKIAYIETNPRLDAALPITEGVAINYYHQMIHYAVNGTYRSIVYDESAANLRFFRFWEHCFIEAKTKLP